MGRMDLFPLHSACGSFHKHLSLQLLLPMTLCIKHLVPGVMAAKSPSMGRLRQVHLTWAGLTLSLSLFEHQKHLLRKSRYVYKPCLEEINNNKKREIGYLWMPFHLEMRTHVSREKCSSKGREGLVFDLESVYLLWVSIQNRADNSDLQAKLQGVGISLMLNLYFLLSVSFFLLAFHCGRIQT